jgi:uncharacterized protein
VSLTKDQIHFFHKNSDIIELNFSLDGNEEIHNTFRQGYKQTMAAIYLYEDTFGKKPRLNATVTRKSVLNKENLVRFYVKNGFDRINFSMVVDVSDQTIAVSREEYEDFLSYCESVGIVMRQKRDGMARVYDCTMFGRLCGVGQTNIFITREGIYPCGRFFGLRDYRLADYDALFKDVEMSFHSLPPSPDGGCYYDDIVRKLK